jgi:hypothetical protein
MLSVTALAYWMLRYEISPSSISLVVLAKLEATHIDITRVATEMAVAVRKLICNVYAVAHLSSMLVQVGARRPPVKGS